MSKSLFQPVSQSELEQLLLFLGPQRAISLSEFSYLLFSVHVEQNISSTSFSLLVFFFLCVWKSVILHLSREQLEKSEKLSPSGRCVRKMPLFFFFFKLNYMAEQKYRRLLLQCETNHITPISSSSLTPVQVALMTLIRADTVSPTRKGIKKKTVKACN